MILFLDFDGVLHPFSPSNRAGAKDFRNLPELETLLRAYSEVEIVITSTRRLTTVLIGLQKRFSPDIAPRVIGTTPSLPMLNLETGQRQAEIDAWLKQHQREHEPWVALDDRADLFRAGAPLVLCCNGLGADQIKALETIFSSTR